MELELIEIIQGVLTVHVIVAFWMFFFGGNWKMWLTLVISANFNVLLLVLVSYLKI